MKKDQEPIFLLTGTYSSFNKGDAAMQLSTAQTLRSGWPNARIVICSPFPEYDRDTYQDYEIVKSHRRNLILGSLQLVCASLFTLLQRIGIPFSFLLFTDEAKITNASTVVVDLSGDTITEDYGPHVTYSHLLPLLTAQALKKPTFVCAQSIGPFKLTSPLVKRVLNRAYRVTARENITYNYLNKLGVKQGVLKETSDMAFLLNPVDRIRTKEILDTEGITETDSLVLGVSVSKLIEDRFAKNNPNNALGSFAQQLAVLIDDVIEKHDMRVIFVSHVTGPTPEKDDRLAAERVFEQMQHKDRAKVIEGNYRPDELKGIISTFDMLVGARMHANIAALSTGVPLLALRYSQKTDGIMQLFNMGAFVANIDTLSIEELASGIDKVITQRKPISKQLGNTLPSVRSESMKNVAIIEDIISGKIRK